ncbi:MAG: response regulator [Gammaproteobacteria bacterium]
MSDQERPTHILLVDDSPDDNFFHQRAIKKSGLDAMVTVATDGEEAIGFLQSIGSRSRGPDLIFLDINMPRMTGWEFLSVYAELPETVQASAVIVMLTTSPHPEDRERAQRNAHVADFVNKPLTAQIMRDMVARFVAGDA